MALSDESRALLQLLLVRGKDYDQIAELLGVERQEVRTRATAALAQISGDQAALEPSIVDYLLGQADPIGRAEAVKTLAGEPEQGASFAEARDQLALLFPDSDLPEAPAGRQVVARAPKANRKKVPAERKEPEGAPPESDRPRPTLDGRTRTILAALVAALSLAAIIAVVVLLGGGGAEQDVIEEPPPPTIASLRPPDGGPARGEVEFGFSGNRFAANVSLSDLAPSRDEEGYALWLEGPAGSFPFDSARVGQEGTIAGQSEISQAIICFIAADLFTEVKVSRVSDAQLTSALRRAVDRDLRQADFPDYVGETVLNGPISMPLESRERIIDVCEGRNPGAAGDSPGS